MSRRHGITWAATSIPEIRRQWCNALDQMVDRYSAQGLTPPAAGAPASRRLQQLKAQLATQMEITTAESQAIREAELYWVARDMVDIAVDAAASLPEWTPALVTPCPNGVLCWAKPAGAVPYGPTPTATVEIPWDAVWWWTRPDGMLQLSPSSRFTTHPELIAPFEVSTPLWAAHTIVLDPRQPRTAEANGTEDAHPFISVVGAAWLLMAQPGVAEARAITDTAPPARPAGAAAATPGTRPQVTIVELRRPTRPAHQSQARSDRQFSRRWWVGGHWRQQACGPNFSERQPKWIAPYIKGPQGKSLTGDRVHVWRR